MGELGASEDGNAEGERIDTEEDIGDKSKK